MKKNRFYGNYAFLCDKGKVRITNEDQVKGAINRSYDVLLCVADGMGGHKKGDLASSIIVETLIDEFKKKERFISMFTLVMWLQKRLKQINNKIFDLQENNEAYHGMGSTLCLALIHKKKLIVVNCGDSRCYILKDNKLVLLTHDDTYVNYLIERGEITKDEALTHPKRHYITNAFGIFPSISYDQKIYKYNGETLFLCSDGLYNNVSSKDIEVNLISKNTLEDKTRSLIDLANYNGGSDNISCLIWESNND